VIVVVLSMVVSMTGSVVGFVAPEIVSVVVSAIISGPLAVFSTATGADAYNQLRSTDSDTASL
jgi:predicted membrane metal-binding protein